MKEMTKKDKTMDKIANFFQNHRTVIWIVFGVIAIVILAFLIWSQVDKSANQAALEQLYTAREAYQEWYLESDEEKRQSLESDLMEKLATITNQFPTSYASQRALMMRADIYFENDEFSTAAKDYLQISSAFPKSDLSIVSLYNAAVCNEELKEFDTAKELYTQVMEKYPESVEAPKSYYAIGRILMAQGENTAANDIFSQIEDKYASSDWQKIAQNLRIELKTKGLSE